MIKKYNPKKINPGWSPGVNGATKTVQFLGFMDSTFIEVEYDEDAVTEHVGADGTVSLVLNANKMATVTVTIVQGSPTNGDLSRLVPDGRRNFLPTGPFSLTDLNGDTLVSGKDAYIKKTAKVEFGKTIVGRKWVFKIPEAEIYVGQGGD